MILALEVPYHVSNQPQLFIKNEQQLLFFDPLEKSGNSQLYIQEIAMSARTSSYGVADSGDYKKLHETSGNRWFLWRRLLLLLLTPKPRGRFFLGALISFRSRYRGQLEIAFIRRIRGRRLIGLLL